MKKTIYFILFLLLLFTACSKENEENIRPIIDLPCEEQGTYFLSATIGDSVLCYASDSAFDGEERFFGVLSDLSEYYGNDTSNISVGIRPINDELKPTIGYIIPVYSKYRLRLFNDKMIPFYDKDSLEIHLNNKVYHSKNIPNQYWLASADFKVGIIRDTYDQWEGSYFGYQDSSYIYLFDLTHLYDKKLNENVKRSYYRVSYEVQSNLYDVSGNYLYPFTSKGSFLFSFFILN
ncbi:hypothetical protein Fleli_1445 [Bernardetia litoralis DSM 6794]|uniref:Lipoprotein n=1 Tax=Bernardetia litoralis (strain ATCC 23117 / DSM 6794 / NBRC 15988 / NCIMB 1366 / Fx l1 / Sio-4) TaxID=880071 RepID=I4AIT7_BERLS|nr:hypothetical protein [Bernardetia litoralis]AFM03872.1 hypothetical protein Fleli_1445 [Bernardetia litoralis DSM 6794]